MIMKIVLKKRSESKSENSDHNESEKIVDEDEELMIEFCERFIRVHYCFQDVLLILNRLCNVCKTPF
jgi:hypothetical protein